MFGADAPAQRCRNHELRNVLGRLLRDQQGQTASLMRAAWKMNQKDGMAKFHQIAGWLQRYYPGLLLTGGSEFFGNLRDLVKRGL